MSKKTILLAEDDPLISIAYKDGLTKAGYQIIHCVSGEEALKAIKKKQPDIILLDLRMPGKDGFQVLEELNKQKLTHEIPIIVTSNLDQESDIEQCKKLGAKDYLIKSNTSLEDVVKVVKKYI